MMQLHFWLMKRTFSLLFFLGTIAAHGQENPERPKNRPLEPGRDKMHVLEFWKKADANNDRKISKEEFLQLPRISQLPEEKQSRLFVHLDKNQNGTLEAAELITAGGPHKPDAPEAGEMTRRSLPRIAEMDQNHDKKITFDEFVKSAMIEKLPEDRRRKIFDKMDRNQDGVLSPEDGPPPEQGIRRPEGKPSDRPEGHFPRVPGSPAAPNPERGFGSIDANQDKFIDFAELQKSPLAARMGEDAVEGLFEKVDTNKDLKIDNQEWRQHSEKGMAPTDQPKHRPSQPAPGAEKKDEAIMEEEN